MIDVLIEEQELNLIFLDYFYKRGFYDTYLTLEKESSVRIFPP